MRSDTQTLDIFAPEPPARAVDTSRAAAAAIRTRAGSIGERVYLAIKGAGARGLTRNELHERTNISIQTLCGRLYELEGRVSVRGRPARPARIQMDRSRVIDGCHPYVVIA